MKRLSPPCEGGPSADREFGVVIQFPRTRSSARPASLAALFSNTQSRANEAERYFSKFTELQRRVHVTLDPVDGTRAAKAFGRYLYAYNQLDDGGLE
jgi:hypothetical protein